MNLMLQARLGLAGGLLLLSSLAHAGITLGGTRVILQAPAKEASIPVKNRGDQDVMIQSWVEAPEGAADKNVPFALTPALSRLGSDKQQMLRIFYQGQGLPTDRESVFWLSVQEIPARPKHENTLQLAVRQRIKLFYRPAGLSGKPEDAGANVAWRLIDHQGKPALEARNPSSYHVSFAGASLDGGRYTAGTRMLAPGATEVFELEGASGRPAATTVDYQIINDYGGVTPHSAPLSH